MQFGHSSLEGLPSLFCPIFTFWFQQSGSPCGTEGEESQVSSLVDVYVTSVLKTQSEGDRLCHVACPSLPQRFSVRIFHFLPLPIIFLYLQASR